MSSSNYIKNIAMVGAGGRSGGNMARAILATGKHTLTALTRAGSSTAQPEGATVREINYDDTADLTEALRGHDALIITLGVTAPADTQSKLIAAAAAAGVAWVLPNEWSPESAHAGLAADVAVFGALAGPRQEIVDAGVSSYVAVSCGFWYEWSTAIPAAFGFDVARKHAVFFDDGATRINVSTWPQVGRAVAALVSLPVRPEPGRDPAACLEAYRNKHVYVKSFLVSQEDILASILRVTGDRREDWTIAREKCTERYAKAAQELRGGDRTGFVKMMYTRVFYQDGAGDFEHRHGVANAVLGLPDEDLDEATRAALERVENPYGP